MGWSGNQSVFGFITGLAGFEGDGPGGAWVGGPGSGAACSRYFLLTRFIRLSFCKVKLRGCICSNSAFHTAHTSGSAFLKASESIRLLPRNASKLGPIDIRSRYRLNILNRPKFVGPATLLQRNAAQAYGHNKIGQRW